MANDFKLAFTDLTKLIPQNLRNDVNTSLVDNLFNRFLTHDESIPLYGYVGRRPASTNDTSPRVPEFTPERDINAIIPVISFKLGTERVAFTVQDLIKKAEAIGISPGGQQWLYSQGNNYVPPINLDKFTNFFNYYWVAKSLPTAPIMPWNPDLLPEYYTIAIPRPSDLNKLNVVATSTESVIRTGTGFEDLSFEVKFTDATHFTITPSGSLGPFSPVQTEYELTPELTHFMYRVVRPNQIVTLLEFDIVHDVIYDQYGVVVPPTPFAPGDRFLIDIEFLTRNYRVRFVGNRGVKGRITKVEALSEYQKIDGVQLTEGDRVLIKDAPPEETGIYIVSPGTWSRAPDFLPGTTATAGARVFTRGGAVNGATMFRSQEESGGFGWTVEPGVTQSNTSEWQEGNYWVRGEDLKALGLGRADAVQAVRPIIEYDGSMQLNTHSLNGRPSDTGDVYRQVKTEFNQLPLFDLFHYDGTHSGLVSSVFYYEEDPTADLDIPLQKRVLKSTNDSADFMFNHGMGDAEGRLLFVKIGDDLRTIWHAGYTAPTIVDTAFKGTGNGTLVDVSATPFTQQQVWTLTATTPTSFTVAGSKMKHVPVPAVVGVPYSNGEIALTIQAGSTAFEKGDTFTIRVGSLESPRYVLRDEEGDIFDAFGRHTLDTAEQGAWQVPRTFFNNPYNESRELVTEGVLNSHFRGIFANQVPGTEFNPAFGGGIKLWSEQQTLLASLLMQRDMTPISMIDLAARQYETALTSVRDIFQQNVVQFIGDHGPIVSDADVSELLSFIETIRAKDNDVRTVLFDSSAPIVGFPATLPQLGISPLVEPRIHFDPVLGVTVLLHHDGHESVLAVDDLDFRQSILGTLTSLQIKRSDNTYTAAVGSFTTAPVLPYKGELWLRPDGTMLTYAVESDRTRPANPVVGTLWLKRDVGQLVEWDGTAWVPSTANPWTPINLADTLNRLMLLVERRLHAGINPNARKFDFSQVMDNVAFQNQLKQELFSFAAINAYDPLAPDYVATDAFTWNYSQANPVNLPPLNTSTVPARWHNLLRAHQATVSGVVPTERPNLEPWKLLGFQMVEQWWPNLTQAQRDSYTPFMSPSEVLPTFPTTTVKAVKLDGISTTRAGIITVDDVVLSNGDRLLLVSEPDPANNGIWVVSGGQWTRAADALVENLIITVSAGFLAKGTTWVVTADPTVIQQVRLWTSQLWADIQAARPALRLSVNRLTDELLPPYVSSTVGSSVDALTNFIPPGAGLGYSFGQDSPVEAVWKKTPEYQYSLARALFRFDPLAFLGFCWGFNWVEMDGILYDGFDMNMPGHKRFRLHGESVEPIARPPLVTNSGSAPLVLTYTAYDAQRRQNFTVTSNGVVLGYAQEGIPATFAGHTFTIEDHGIPFRIGDRFEISQQGATAFLPTNVYTFLGFGQTFTHALRETSIDTESSYAVSAYREWDVNMGYRAGGLVATDDLSVYTDMETLSDTAYDLIFKRNQIARNEWVQALRVQVMQMGTSITTENGGFAPTTDGADWTFRIEGYNPRYLSLTYYQLVHGKDVTFHALSKAHTDLAFQQPTIIGSVQTINLPITIVGLQNVVDFLFGYALYLEHRGWEFNQLSENNIDAETGRHRNFQLEIEKLVDRCYAGINLGEGHVVNPFIDRAWFNQETGLLSEFIDTSLFDVTGHPGAFDTLGVKYKKADLDIVRTNTRSSFGASGPMFSAHVQLDEFEHLFIFNNYSQPSLGTGLLYDPFSGGRVVTYKFNGRKQATHTMRPEFGGHFLVGNKVHQNLQASTDNVANFYDANRVFENETTTRHALALLGFNTKEYFDNLDISSKSQFNFWRGLIQLKGTNLSINAFLNNNRFTDAKVDEFWGYKVANYGDARQLAFPELKLTADDATTQFTSLQFDSDTLKASGFATIDHFDEKRWFSLEDMPDEDVYFAAESVGIYHKTDAVIGGTYKLPFIADYLVPHPSFTQVNATTVIAQAWGAAAIDYTHYGQINASNGANGLIGIQGHVGATAPFEVADWPQPRTSTAQTFLGNLAEQSFGQVHIGAGASPIAVGDSRGQGAGASSPINITSSWYVPMLPTDKLWIKEQTFNGQDGAYSFIIAVGPSVDEADLYSAVGSAKATVQDWTITRLPNGRTINTATSTALHVEGFGPARPRFNPLKLFNYVDNELVTEIPMWHPAVGQHTPAALESINIISSQNPAKYNYSTLVSNNNTYDPLRPWGAHEVGRVWLDTTNLVYVPYYDPAFFNLDERLSRWGTLTDFATVDVYEWVQSTVPPNEYDALALEQAGDANLDVTTKAAGEAARQNTYVRDRTWFMRSIAWSYSPVPVDVNWGATPPFPAGSTDADLLLRGGKASLSQGSFKQYGIEAGMRLGAWNNDANTPKPLSEYVIEDAFTKELQDAQRNPFVAQLATAETSIPSIVDVAVTGYSDISGQLLFTAVPITPVPITLDEETGKAASWAVDVLAQVTEVGSGETEYALVTSAIGTIGPIEEVPYDPGQPYIKAVAGQEFRPPHPGQPYIEHVEGQEYIPPHPGQPYIEAGAAQDAIPPTDAVPATSGYQIVRLVAGTTLTTPTGYQSPSPTAEFVSLTIDGVTTDIPVEADTVGDLINQINDAYVDFDPVSFIDGNIVVSSPTTGVDSMVEINASSVTLDPLESIDDPVQGEDEIPATPGQPAREATAGQPYIPPHPGQPYIRHVQGQPYIPPDPGQEYIREEVGQEYIPETKYVAPVPAPYLYGATISVSTGEKFDIEFPVFGLTVTVTISQGGTYPADELRNAIVEALASKIFVRDAVVVTPVVPGPHTDLSNNLDDSDDRPGWRVWTIPTQAQLDADGQQPTSSWKPYVGDFDPIPGNLTQIQDAVNYAKSPLTLNNGFVVERYNTEWLPWSIIENKHLRYPKDSDDASYDVTRVGNDVTFEYTEKLDPVRTSVYVNGIAQLKAAIVIKGKFVTVSNVPASAEVAVIIRKYEPTAFELAFDPDVLENLAFQRQYKQDYEYVSQPVRDREGALSSTLYYFWVKNKTTAAPGKKMSIQSIAQELRDGPNNYLTFQNFLPSTTGKPHRYDAITVAGLNYIISKDDTFKLRFTRNFTLRDEPEQLNLKNVHTEWALMREGQRMRVPEALWNKLTDSVAGVDSAGNEVPALRRVLYDERNGTRTQFGFGEEQTLAPSNLLRNSIADTIVNTKLVDDSLGIPMFIEFLDPDDRDLWFADAASARQTMTDIWNRATVAQVNEIFFSALNDVLAHNYELDSIFKTSRLSAYSIKVVANNSRIEETYE